MNRRHGASRTLLVKLGGCLFLFAALVACQNSANVSRSDNRSRSSASESQDSGGAPTQQASDDDSAPATQQASGRNTEVCRKYDACGCQKYDDCMADLANSTAIDEPGTRECLLKSSCQSLCAGKPDGCSGPGTSAGNPGGVQQRTNCAAIYCSKNSDCPTECYGGCGDSRVCLSF